MFIYKYFIHASCDLFNNDKHYKFIGITDIKIFIEYLSNTIEENNHYEKLSNL